MATVYKYDMAAYAGWFSFTGAGPLQRICAEIA